MCRLSVRTGLIHIAGNGGPNYSGVVFWFWFRVLIIPLMFLLDAAWWMAAMRLTKRRLWRVLVSVFMAGQMAGLLLAIFGSWWHVDLLGQTPKAVLVAVFIWHFFGVGVLLPLGIVCVCAWMVRGVARLTGVRRNRPVAAPTGGNSLTRREFMGAAAALAPPLFTVSLTFVE
jgi:hypothetical protein